MAGEAVVVGVAGRAYPGESVSGDAWQLDQLKDRYRLSMVDGLGHGQLAADASTAALRLLRRQPELGPSDALQACHTELLSTRGAAMWVGCLDLQLDTLTYAGVGNVDGRLWQAGRQHRLVAQRGIVGGTLPTVRSFELPLGPGWILLVHTDGIRERFDVDVLPELVWRDPQGMADGILREWGRATDDALVVVARAA